MRDYHIQILQKGEAIAQRFDSYDDKIVSFWFLGQGDFYLKLERAEYYFCDCVEIRIIPDEEE